MATQGQTNDVIVLKGKMTKLEVMFVSTSIARAGEYTAILGTHTFTIDL